MFGYYKKMTLSKKLIAIVLTTFLAVVLSLGICLGTSKLVAEAEKNNPSVVPLSLKGMGTYASPYMVTTCADFQNLSAYTTFFHKVKKLLHLPHSLI